MKKILSAIALGALLLPTAAFASAITLAPTSVATTEGKSFSVTIGVDPSSGKAYTVRANISFDPSVLTLTDFSFAPKWMPLSQSGYDITDNVNGALVKTGGYPGGATAGTILGTATFRAKKSGATVINATADSLILDASNKNAVAGSQGSVAVTIATAIAPSTPVQTVTKPAVTPVETAISAVIESTTTEIASTSNEVAPQTASALSSLDNILTLNTGSAAVASLVTIVVIATLGGGIWLWRRRRSDS